MAIAQGDLFKTLDLQLTLLGAPFPIISGDTLVLRWLDSDGVEHEVTPTKVGDGSTGQITYEFQAGETDAVGYQQGQVTLTRSGKPLSFPDDGSYFIWEVTPKI